MARHGALGQAGDGGELAAARPALAGLVGESDEALQREVQMPANGAVQVEADGDVGEQKGLRGCSATRPEAADFGHTLPVHAKRACENRRGREISVLLLTRFSRPRPVCRPAFPGGFLLYEFWVSRPRENRDRTRRIARTWR